MKTIEQVRLETEGAVYTFNKFLEYVIDKVITSYDGGGHFHDGENETDVTVDPDDLYLILECECFDNGLDIDDVDSSDLCAGIIKLPNAIKELRNKYPYVIWFNR